MNHQRIGHHVTRSAHTLTALVLLMLVGTPIFGNRRSPHLRGVGPINEARRTGSRRRKSAKPRTSSNKGPSISLVTCTKRACPCSARGITVCASLISSGPQAATRWCRERHYRGTGAGQRVRVRVLLRAASFERGNRIAGQPDCHSVTRITADHANGANVIERQR
jgi:hypothetical protein